MKKKYKQFALIFLIAMLLCLNSLAQEEEYDDIYYYPQKENRSQSVQDKNNKKSKNVIISNNTITNAQKSHYSVYLSPIFPISLNNNASVGLLSGRISYGYDITKKISWCLSAAYNKFGKKTVTSYYYTNYKYESNLAYIPITTGFKFFFKDGGTRGYFVAKGGYFFPAADFEKGGFGISSGFGLQIPSNNDGVKFDISLEYNAAFGGTTKEYILHYGNLGGSTRTSNYYTWASYLALNIGLVFGK